MEAAAMMDGAGEALLQTPHERRVAAAREQQASCWPTTRSGHWYPSYHIAPPCGWLSVPHGLCFFNGLYHVFYQHNPFSVEWGTMHWGHSTSPDLIHWQHQPPALAPGSYAEGDRDGCFSGSAVAHKGKLYIFYTGHQWVDEATYEELYSSTSDTQPDTHSSLSGAPQRSAKAKEGIYQQQCLAISEDGINFVKRGPILRPPKGFIHCRDPKVWVQEERWFMVVGARDAHDVGLLLLYSSSDPQKWNPANYTVLARTTDKNVFMWECPDFFAFGSEFMLLVCPQGTRPKGYEFRNTFPSVYAFGFFGSDKVFNTSIDFTEVDKGQDFYSPQTFVAPDGRRLMIGWLGGWGTNFPSAEQEGWSSHLTLPRELSRDPKTGRIRQTPPRELKLLRQGEGNTLGTLNIGDRLAIFLCNCGSPHEMDLTLQLCHSKAERYGVWFGKGAELYVDTQADRLVLARHYPDYFLCDSRSCSIKNGATFLRLHLFIDKSSVEVFVDGGEHTFSARLYPSEEEESVSLFSIGGSAELVKGQLWPLHSTIAFSPEEDEANRQEQHRVEEEWRSLNRSGSGSEQQEVQEGVSSTVPQHPLTDVPLHSHSAIRFNDTHHGSELVAGGGTADSCYSLYPSPSA